MTTAPTQARGERIPPQDEHAEQSVLGGMLLSKDAIADVVEILRGEDFYFPNHAAIFTAVTSLFGDGQPADVITVANSMGPAALAKVGGGPYLHTLMSVVPTASNAGYYARIVADKATRRRLLEAGFRVGQLVYSDTGDDADALVDRAQQMFYDLDGQRTSQDARDLGSLMQPTLDLIEEAGTGRGPLGVPSGFSDFDRLLNGAKPGQLIVVGGRPGQGKSVFGIGWAVHAAVKHQLPAAVFSLEMSALEITKRVLAAEARVSLTALDNGRLSDDEWTRLARRMGEVGEAPLYIDDTPNMSLMEIRAKARRMRQRNDLRLMVVDYLQLMTPSRRVDNRQQEVAEMSRGLKLLARELEIPVIVASQLNRGSETRQDKRPTLADLRESGAIEQDADVVILLHRDDYYDKESPRAGEADFIVAKHRNGPTDTVTVAAQLHFARFVDMAIA